MSGEYFYMQCVRVCKWGDPESVQGLREAQPLFTVDPWSSSFFCLTLHLRLHTHTHTHACTHTHTHTHIHTVYAWLRSYEMKTPSGLQAVSPHNLQQWPSWHLLEVSVASSGNHGSFSTTPSYICVSKRCPQSGVRPHSVYNVNRHIS